MQHERGHERGTTVLETTVCIIILGVVLSILMPAIGLLRENALSTRCQQHLRAMFPAMQHYMADYLYENWLPASELPNGQFWFQKLEPFVAGHASGRSKENFVCPRAPVTQRGFTRSTVSFGWNERYLSFGVLSNKVNNADETIVVADSLAGPEADIVLPMRGDLRFATRHRGRGNVLFLGGNVASMTRAEAEFEWPRYWDTR